MRTYLILLLFIAIFSSLNLKLEENVIPINLSEKTETKYRYNISTKETYKIFTTSDKYIYFLEFFNDTEVHDINNQTFKKLVCISSLNDSIIIYPKEIVEKETYFYVVSIKNDEVEAQMEKRTDFHISFLLNKNLINIIHVKENEEKIITLSSSENSVVFSFWKYEYLENFDSGNIYPINRTLFTRYNESIIKLEKDSVYIFIAEKYIINSPIYSIDIFVSSLDVDKNISLEYNMIYLKENDDYHISFPNSNLSRILKLSKKTIDSKITLNGEIILSSNNIYYNLTEEQINNGIIINVTNGDALIEILFSSNDDSEVLSNYSIKDYKLTKLYTIINIPKIKCTYDFQISSKNKNKLKLFEFGYNHKISKNNYFYSWINFSEAYDEKGIDLLITSPYLYRTETDEDEYQIFEIVLNQEQLDNDIYLSYNPTSYYEYLHKPIDEKTCEYIIGNISSILNKYYIYKDIAKNPPEIEGLPNYQHQPIDLLGSLRNITKINRTHFNFYQDIFKVISTVRDGHLSIILKTIENSIDLSSTAFCSPFELYIDNNNVNNISVIKMRAFNKCLEFMPEYKDRIIKYIEDHIDIPILFINGSKPFDFIQNFGTYQLFKSKHAKFTYSLNSYSKITSVVLAPYDLSDIIDIKYEFENGDIMGANYILFNQKQLNNIENQDEFEEFYRSFFYNQPNPYLIPNIFQVHNLFLKKKDLLFEDAQDKIEWNYTTVDDNLKCRVDKEHKKNVFLQKSFSFSSLENALYVMIKCSELFYSNDFQIIGIEDSNGGGYANLYEIWHQLIQQKTLDKSYRSLIINNDSIDFFKKNKYYSGYSNIETCKYYSSIEDMGKIIDDYGNNDFHNRSKVYDFIDKNGRKILEKIREKNFLSKNLKKSTDILIFTDGFCFSACSGFIKAFQNTGGAIIVGYNGNPNITIPKEFDGSQSSSSVSGFDSEEYYALQNLGYYVPGITYSESFDDSYQKNNGDGQIPREYSFEIFNKSAPIPREYSVDPVDRRVPIYSSYSDDLYEKFLYYADNIFDEFKTKCNKNNSKLVLDNENCSNNLNAFEKGGNPCGDNGEWDKNKCQAYYCELGYYYDQYQNKCVLDICTHINETEYYINNDSYMITKEFTVEPDSEIVLHLSNHSYIYFIESEVNDIISYNNFGQEHFNGTNLCIFNYESQNSFDYDIDINYYKNIQTSTKIKITTVETIPNIISNFNFNFDSIENEQYINLIGENQLIYTFQLKEKSIVFTHSFNKGIKAYYHEFNFDISPQEIINIDPNKFKESTNNPVIMKENKTYIFIMKTPQNIASNLFTWIRHFNANENIIISNDRFLYLTEQNFDYNLYFESNSNTIYIKLCSQTTNAEIEILNNNIILNKTNKYFLWDKNMNKLSLRLKNNNSALIEFFYELKNINNLDINQKTFDLVRGHFYMIECKKSDKIESIKVNLESNKELSLILYSNFVKDNHLGGTPSELSFNTKYLTTIFLVPNEQLDDDENFNILIRTKNNATLSLELNKEKDDGNNQDNKSNEDNNDLPNWALILIILFSALIILAIILIAIRYYYNKKHNELDNIEAGKLLNSEETD